MRSVTRRVTQKNLMNGLLESLKYLNLHPLRYRKGGLNSPPFLIPELHLLNKQVVLKSLRCLYFLHFSFGNLLGLCLKFVGGDMTFQCNRLLI